MRQLRKPYSHASSAAPSLLVPIPGTSHYVPAASLREAATSLGMSPSMPHQAATTGRRLGTWRPTGAGPNAVVSSSAPELVRRSRDLRRNNPHGKRALDLYPVHVVGIGIKPRFLVRHAKTRQALTELWEDWVKTANADGLLDFYGLQALAVSEMAEGGEAFCRLRPRFRSDALPVPLQLQILPTEQVPLSYSQVYGGNVVEQGIERDRLGRRVAYWAYNHNPGEATFQPDPHWGMPQRIPASNMVHLFNAMGRAGQMRGLPWLAAAITTLFQIGSFRDAELLRKQMVANVVGFVKKALAGADIDTEELAKQWGEILDGAGGELPAVALEPGTMQYLDLGEDVEFSQPADVGGSFDAFVSWSYRDVAAAAGLLYEELTGDWKNANDRTFRAQFNNFKRGIQQLQFGIVCHQLNEPIKNRFVDYAVASGAIRVPKSVTDSELRRVSWHPHRFDYLNPKQDVETIIAEIEGGLTPRQDVIAERGDDAEVIDRKFAEDRERERQLSLNFGTAKAKAVVPQPAEGASA